MTELQIQRIYQWGYCDACDDLHPTLPGDDPMEWDEGAEDRSECDTPTAVYIGMPDFLRDLSITRPALRSVDD